MAPVLLGPANALAATGASWRWVRDAAAELRVPLLKHGKKQFVDAAAFVAALRKAQAAGDAPRPEGQEDEPMSVEEAAAIIRNRIGLRLRGRG